MKINLKVCFVLLYFSVQPHDLIILYEMPGYPSKLSQSGEHSMMDTLHKGQSWGSYFMKVIYYILLVTFTKK